MRRSRASQRSIRKCLWSVRPPLGEASWHQGGRASLRTKKAGGAKKEQRQGSRATRMTLNFPWSVKSVSVWCRPCLTPTPAVAFIDPFPFHGTRALGPFLGRANSECRSVLSESVSAQLLSARVLRSLRSRQVYPPRRRPRAAAAISLSPSPPPPSLSLSLSLFRAREGWSCAEISALGSISP